MLEDYSPEATKSAISVLRMLRPKKILGMKKIRIGQNFDGGYVMIDRFDGIDAAYSLGISNDVSWDLDIANYGIPLFQYDPTIASLPQDHPLFHWEPVWVGGAQDKDKNIETIENLIDRNGHKHLKNMILKCDIEGAEWEMLQTVSHGTLSQFNQIVFEIHDLFLLAQPENVNKVRSAIKNLTATHHLVHIHGNNYGGWAIVGGIPLPNVIEVTMLRKDAGNFVDSDEVFPTSMDMPCRKDIADLYIGNFDFEI